MSLALARPRAATLAELRLLTAPPQRKGLPFSRFPRGIPRGAITEISGPHGGGKTRFALGLLAENPGVRVAWVEEELTIYPRAFSQAGVMLSRVLFAEAGEHAFWVAHQCLRSGIFGVVVLSVLSALSGLAAKQASQPSQIETGQIALRRLQLAAERAAAAVIILTETATNTGSWPIAVQLDVNHNSVRRLKW